MNNRLEYLEFMSKSNSITNTRRLYDKALQALPVTQHDLIWTSFLRWVKSVNIPELSYRTFKRYVMFNADGFELLVQYLIDSGDYSMMIREVVRGLEMGNNSLNYYLISKITDVISEQGKFVVADAKYMDLLFRRCIAHYPDEIGPLWCKFAQCYIHLGEVQRANDIFEEGMDSVATIRDFTLVFENYVKIIELLVHTQMSSSLESNNTDLDLLLSKLEYLVEKRSLLINSVMLRQNPSNVVEWMKRIKLLKDDSRQQLLTFIEALKTIDPSNCFGKLSSLWLGLAHFYESKDDLSSCRSVYENAVKVKYRNLSENMYVWSSWAEFEIRYYNEREALNVLQRALSDSNYQSKVPKNQLFANVKLWAFYLDLLTSLGTVDACKSAYEKAIDFRVINPTMVLNYASYLQSFSYYEESFAMYERVVEMFNFSEARILWLRYIKQFDDRYKGSKIERMRDIFGNVCKVVPTEYAAEFYILHANFEESHGYDRNAVSILDKATKVVPSNQKYDMYVLFILKIELLFGITKTRQAYERAIMDLDDVSSRQMCINFAGSERKLGEIDRARAVLIYGSQTADPKRDMQYWEYWQQFEEVHGNEDTYREMLRIRRSTEAAYAQIL